MVFLRPAPNHLDDVHKQDGRQIGAERTKVGFPAAWNLGRVCRQQRILKGTTQQRDKIFLRAGNKYSGC